MEVILLVQMYQHNSEHKARLPLGLNFRKSHYFKYYFIYFYILNIFSNPIIVVMILAFCLEENIT